MVLSIWPPNSLRMADSSFSPKVLLDAGAEAGIKRRGDHGRRHRLVHGRLHGPAAFAAIIHLAAELLQVLRFGQRDGGQVQQPGRHHAAAPPDLGDIGDIDVETFILRQVLVRRGPA